MPVDLLVRPGAIGDALLALPALATLRAQQPERELALVAHPAVADLVEAEGLVDRFISRDSTIADALFAPSPRLALELVGPLDRAVVWTADRSGRLAANLRALGADPVLLAASRPVDGSRLHVAQHLVDTLAPLGVRAAVDRWLGLRAALGPSPEPPALPEAGPLVVLHVGSGSPRKNWPLERFAALGRLIWSSASARVVFPLGPAEAEARDALERAADFPHAVVEQRPLLELARLLAACQLYVGNDSGLSHLAGLSRAPTLALFGPTDPALWRPLGSRVRVLRTESLAELPVQRVATAALDLLSGRSP